MIRGPRSSDKAPDKARIVGHRGGRGESERERLIKHHCPQLAGKQNFSSWKVARRVPVLPLVCFGVVWSPVAGVWHALVGPWSLVLPLGCTCSDRETL